MGSKLRDVIYERSIPDENSLDENNDQGHDQEYEGEVGDEPINGCGSAVNKFKQVSTNIPNFTKVLKTFLTLP